MSLLGLVTVLPAAGALALLALPAGRDGLHRAFALAVSLLAFALSIPLWTGFDSHRGGFQFVESYEWIDRWGVGWRVGIDGASLALVMLTTLLTPVALLAAWRSIGTRVREFLVAMLVLETGMLGVFVATDLFLFYLFWEVMLVPMFLIIGVWGGPNRIYAAMKFFLYTVVGSLLMLVAIAWLWLHSGRSFDFAQLLAAPVPAFAHQWWLFLAFFLAFAIKVPMWPLHTWLPDAHVEAPTPGSVILAAVLLKMGGYGMYRLAIPLFPEAADYFAPIVLALSVIAILYGGAVALVQDDMKKLVAYSSVSHLGFVTLGLFAFTQPAMQGAVLHMVNHGLSTGLLFLLVGMLYERRHTRLISEYGGVAKPMPGYAAAFVLTALASAGLPLLNGFVGEFLILVGTVPADPLAAVLAASGVVLAAAYLLYMLRRVLFGPVDREENRALVDLDRREWACLLPLLALVVLLGVWPKPLLDRTEKSVHFVLERLGRAPAEAARAAGE